MRKAIAPKSLSPAQKRSFGQLAKQLGERGVDPADRVDLIADFITIGDRIDALRRQEVGSAGQERLQLARAISTAQTERRRVRDRLWEGARPVVLIPTEAEALATDRQSAADDAWRAYFATLKGLRGGRDDAKIAEADRVGKDLEARHGPPSWNVLLDPASARFVAENDDDGGAWDGH